ncbi:hypothetical protein PV458_36485 [Streptomyces sp. MN03-5084-2B]|nr:hypothetical protein [Streptomyces sp. MN03-5084-2B]
MKMITKVRAGVAVVAAILGSFGVAGTIRVATVAATLVAALAALVVPTANAATDTTAKAAPERGELTVDCWTLEDRNYQYAYGACDGTFTRYRVVAMCFPDFGDPGVDDVAYYGPWKRFGAISLEDCPEYSYLDRSYIALDQ